jgi:WD40 repeat protein
VREARQDLCGFLAVQDVCHIDDRTTVRAGVHVSASSASFRTWDIDLITEPVPTERILRVITRSPQTGAKSVKKPAQGIVGSLGIAFSIAAGTQFVPNLLAQEASDSQRPRLAINVFPKLAACSMSDDGEIAAIAGLNSVLVVEVKTGQVIRRLERSSTVAPSLLIDSQRQHLWIAERNGPLIRLSTSGTASGREMFRLPPVAGNSEAQGDTRIQGLAMSPDHALIAVALSQGDIWLVSSESEQQRRLDKYLNTASKIAFSRTGQWIAAIDFTTGIIGIWDVTSGHLTGRLVPESTTEAGSRRSNEPPKRYDISFSSSDSELISIQTSPVGVVARRWPRSVWRDTPASPLRAAQPTQRQLYQAWKPERVAFSPDGSWFSAVDNSQMHRWLTESGMPLSPATFSITPSFTTTEPLSMQLCLANESLAYIDRQGRSLRVWTDASNVARTVFSANSSQFMRGLFSSNGRWLVTEMNDGIVRWDLMKGGGAYRIVGWTPGTLDSERLLSISPESDRVAVLGVDFSNTGPRRVIQLYRIEDGERVGDLASGSYSEEQEAMALSPDWTKVARVYSQTIQIAGLDASPLRWTSLGPAGTFDKLMFSPRGRWLGWIRSNRQLGIFDTTSWTLRTMGNTFSFQAFSNDDRFVAMLIRMTGGMGLRLIDLLDGTETRQPGYYPVVFDSLSPKLLARKADTRDLFFVEPNSLEPQLAFKNVPQGPAVVNPKSGVIVMFSGDATLWDPLSALPNPVARLAALSDTDTSNHVVEWVVGSESTGLFDGTSTAIRSVGWEIGRSNENVTLDALFGDFFSPGLLTAVSSRATRPTPPNELITQVRIPGLRSLVKGRFAHVDEREGKTVLCLAEAALPPVNSPLPFYANTQTWRDAPLEQREYVPSDRLCPWRVPIDSELASLGKDIPEPTPISSRWDTEREAMSRGTLHVLTVGIDRYNHPDFPALVASVSAARALEDAFIRVGDLRRRDVRIWDGLFNRSATKSAIQAVLFQMRSEVRPEDTVLVFLSGHGTVPAAEEMFYFVPADLDTSGIDALRDGALSAADFADAFRNLPASRLILIIDSCQSGSAVDVLREVARSKIELGEQMFDQGGEPVGVVLVASTTPISIALQRTGANPEPSEVASAVIAAITSGTQDSAGLSSHEFAERVRAIVAKGDPSRPSIIEAVGIDFAIVPRPEQ